VARDHLGVKPLFLYQDSTCLVFATDVAGVLGYPRVSTALSDEAVAQFLAQGELYSDRQTFYRDVRKLPPATRLVIAPSGVTERVYWEPAMAPKLAYQSTEDYVHELRSLFESAVAVRLPDAGLVGTHLSGGLDSSAIAFQAAKQGADLKAWTWMRTPGSASERGCAEWERSLSVAQQLGVDLEFTDLDPAQMEAFLDADLLAVGDSTDLYYEYWVRHKAKADGVQVMLSGWGGDQFISNQGYYRYFETFWRGSLLATLEDIWDHSKVAQVPLRRFLGLCFRYILKPLVPSPSLLMPKYSFLKFANPEIAALGVTQKFANGPPLSGVHIRSQQLDELRYGHIRNRLEGWAVAGGRAGIEYRYPLLDKRIVEFALGLPPELYLQRGYPRYIFRAAMSEDLSAEICWKEAKREPLRVSEGLAAGRRSLIAWRKGGPAVESRYINTSALNSWVDGIDQSSCQDSSRHVLDLLSAFKAKLVLNLEAQVPLDDVTPVTGKIFPAR
jgi:asparagine synthase (glutamine-hydrolysing)